MTFEGLGVECYGINICVPLPLNSYVEAFTSNVVFGVVVNGGM